MPCHNECNDNSKPQCLAECKHNHPCDTRWNCSRRAGHTGEHTACYEPDRHNLCSWSDKPACVWCSGGKAKLCCKQLPDDIFICWRNPGHSGPHVACTTIGNHNITQVPGKPSDYQGCCAYCVWHPYVVKPKICDKIIDTEQGYVCTRPPDHKGVCVACAAPSKHDLTGALAGNQEASADLSS